MPFTNEFGEGGAIIERSFSNAGYGVGDGDGGEGGATLECIVSNAGYGVGDGGRLASYNQGIGSRLNNRIAVLARIVHCVPTFHYYGGEGGAILERIRSNAGYGVGEGDGGEGGAIIERTVSNAGYGVGEGDGGEGGA